MLSTSGSIASAVVDLFESSCNNTTELSYLAIPEVTLLTISSTLQLSAVSPELIFQSKVCDML